jgi:hypothetical protein
MKNITIIQGIYITVIVNIACVLSGNRGQGFLDFPLPFQEGFCRKFDMGVSFHIRYKLIIHQ